MTAVPPPIRPPAELLGRWLHDALLVGRWPFRMVERDVAILTSDGPAKVPLVIWINRDSLLCGGLLFFGSADDEALPQYAATCATALGQESFLLGTGATLQIHSVSAPRLPQRSLPLPHAATAINTVLEQLKLLSLPSSNAAPPSASHFATLCQFALMALVPLLDERRREAQAATPVAHPVGAAHQAALLLWRLLALSFYKQLPGQLRPEELQLRMAEHLIHLPAELHPQLAILSDELTIPPACAVRLHHLLHRLTQLRFFDDHQRAAATIALLLQTLAPHLGVAPPPSVPDNLPVSEILFADRLVDHAVVIAPPAVVAGLALKQTLLSASPLQAAASLFTYRFPPDTPRSICGTLAHSEFLNKRQRREVAMHLRQSWPTRRFRLTSLPLWAAELIHLLGAVPNGSKICLFLPQQLLLKRDYRMVLGLIASRMDIVGVALSSDGQIRLDLLSLSTAAIGIQTERQRWFAAAAKDDEAHDQLWTRLFPKQDIPPAARGLQITRHRLPRSNSRQLDERIAGEVFRDGIPRFPEQYLYDYYRPALVTYIVAPPVDATERFFDRYHLRDAAGTPLTAENGPQALALLFAGYRQSTFALPTDETLTATIVARYRRDLLALYSSLRTTVYRHLGPGAKGERMIRQLWERFDLPPFALFLPGADPLGEGLPLAPPSGI